MTPNIPVFMMLGKLEREYLITPDGKVFIDQPGGNLLYAAAGAAIWLEDDETLGLVSRVGEDYPRKWIDDYQAHGFNTEGIKILPETPDLRKFIAYSNLRSRSGSDPVTHFAQMNIPYPKTLLGYKERGNTLDSRTKLTLLSIRQHDIPKSFQYASVAHLCAVDFLTHSLIPVALRQFGVTTITLDPGPGYMDKSFWDLVPSIMPGLTAFMPSEKDLRNLFAGHTQDLWEMAEAVANWGCKIVVIKRGVSGQLMYDSVSGKRYEIPAYPTQIVDLTGAGEVFSGGFMVGYKRTFNPLLAVIYGSVSASIAIEGSGAFYTRQVLPGLAQARLESLKDAVRQV
jgi:sugar/nucleoside kinase (ribokinase family)